MKNHWRFALLALFASPAVLYAESPDGPSGPDPRSGIRVGRFAVEVRTTFTTNDGLPDDNVLSVATGPDGTVYAATGRGLCKRSGATWEPLTDHSGPVKLLAIDGDGLLATMDDGLYRITGNSRTLAARLPNEARDPASLHSLAAGRSVLLGTTAGLFRLIGDRLLPVDRLHASSDSQSTGSSRDVRQVAIARDGRVAAAMATGLFVSDPEDIWQAVFPHAGHRSWAPRDVRGVAFDSLDRLWFASPQGVGVFDGDQWTLYTGHDGLPYNDFTTVAAGEQGVVWFGTKQGAIRFDGRNWEYRMAPRWLPDNLVLAIAVSPAGHAWFATLKGAGWIERRQMTLAEKADYFEQEIDRYNRRTSFGYVDAARLANPGDKSQWTNHDSDNDGLWTSMYGAAECFAYAATRNPKFKQRAQAAFEAVRFLSEVTQGGTPAALPGFPARTILPASAGNPNLSAYTPEHDREMQKRDPLWKVIVPRWPQSRDGKWYWKCDTSSDELDGHYFLYAVYYDLVAETDAEKARVRDVVVAITDHLIEHGFQLIDHDGQPTRWARYGPPDLNGDVLEGARGLNSMSILSYLNVAHHMTGDPKYRDASRRLIDEHSYVTNLLEPKRRNGPGTGNQSDDEMAFMGYYNLIRYEPDAALKRKYLWSLRWYWLLEEQERSSLFNFIFAALDDGGRIHALRLPERESYLAEAVDTLKRIPLDRVRWSYQNSHRIDVVLLPNTGYRNARGGHLRNGKVIPVDERAFSHWSYDPWQLDENNDGRSLTDGATFLLPYYMGLYHGFIVE